MSLFSNMTNHRQHHGQGNEQLLYELQLHFTYPVNNSGQDFKKVIHLTQANQAMSYKTAAEFHRRNRDYLNKTSALGNCMGFMYWQLNDVIFLKFILFLFFFILFIFRFGKLLHGQV